MAQPYYDPSTAYNQWLMNIEPGILPQTNIPPPQGQNWSNFAPPDAFTQLLQQYLTNQSGFLAQNQPLDIGSSGPPPAIMGFDPSELIAPTGGGPPTDTSASTSYPTGGMTYAPSNYPQGYGFPSVGNQPPPNIPQFGPQSDPTVAGLVPSDPNIPGQVGDIYGPGISPQNNFVPSGNPQFPEIVNALGFDPSQPQGPTGGGPGDTGGPFQVTSGLPYDPSQPQDYSPDAVAAGIPLPGDINFAQGPGGYLSGGIGNALAMTYLRHMLQTGRTQLGAQPNQAAQNFFYHAMRSAGIPTSMQLPGQAIPASTMVMLRNFMNAAATRSAPGTRTDWSGQGPGGAGRPITSAR